MKGWLISLACLAAFGAGAQDMESVFETPPEIHYRGVHYLNCTNLGVSYIKYQTGDEQKNAALRRYALAIAHHVQIPPERVAEGDLYKGRPTLWIVWRPWHSPFDKTAPDDEQPTAYRILTSKRGILLQANNPDGALFGTKVILRLLEALPGPYIQRMAITDWRDVVDERELRSLKKHPYAVRKPARAPRGRAEAPRKKATNRKKAAARARSKKAQATQ